MNKKIQDMYVKEKASFFSIILIVIYFLIPFMIINIIISAFPSVFGDDTKTKEFYADTNNRTWMLVITIALIFLISIIESFVLKRTFTFKVLYKYSNDKSIRKLALIWTIIRYFAFIPIVSLIPEILYIINKQKIKSAIHELPVSETKK